MNIRQTLSCEVQSTMRASFKRILSPKAGYEENSTRQFFNFLIVGSFNTGLSYSLFLALYLGLHANYLIAGITSYACCAITGFLMNRYFTFKSQISILEGVIKYFLVQFICLLTHSSIIIIATEKLNINPLISQLLGISITLFINFFISRQFVFKSVKSTSF